MALIKRHWTPEEAEEWTAEDVIVWILSPLSYALISVGTALAIFLKASGFIMLGAGIAVTWIMFAIADPKLKVISTEYEKKQKEYLIRLERITRWKE